MPTIKTAVSLPAEIYQKTEKLRKKLDKSRSQIFSDALSLMIKTAEINEKEARDADAYRRNPATAEELAAAARLAAESLGPFGEDWSEEYNASR